MSGREQGWTSGLPVHGELAEGTSAAAGLEIPIYAPDGRRRYHGPNEVLNIVTMAFNGTDAVLAYLFADFAMSAAITAASTGDDTLTVAGDLSHILPVGATFAVLGSTGNDAGYTVTSVTYSAITGNTVIGVAAVADGTADGSVYWLAWDVDSADATANTITVAGDQTRYFHVDRLFRVEGSTGNDNSDSNYTVTAASYDSTVGTTTITVSSVASSVGDGRVILQPTDAVGRRYCKGDYQALGGRERNYSERLPLQAGFILYADAEAGAVEFEFQAFLRKHIERTP